MTLIAPESIHWRSSDGLQLHARDYRGESGDRAAVICLPGVTRNARDFEDVAPWLAAQGRRVIAVDLRGRGSSAYDRRPSNYNPNVYARDIGDLIASLGLKRAHILGTSLGGIIAMTMALKSTHDIAGAVLNDVGPKPGAAGLKRIMGYVGKQTPITNWEDARAYVARINGAAFPSFGDADWERFARRTFKDSGEGVPQLDYDPRIARRVSAPATRMASMLMWNGFRRLAGRRPTLIIRGEHSDILEPDTLQRMRSICPTSLHVTVSGVGHAPTLDEGDARDALRGFFAIVE